MRPLFFISILLVFTGCDVKVKTIYDHRVDFSQYKTFCWMNGCEFTYTGPAYIMTPQGKEYIQKGIIAEMAEKGIAYNSENPDLLIDLHITMENEKIYTYHREENEDFFTRFYDKGLPMEVDLLKGTLVVDIADRKEGRMIWRSVATSYLDLHPDISEKNIRRGISISLKKFPPEPAKTLSNDSQPATSNR